MRQWVNLKGGKRMQGLVTKKHFFKIWEAFGIRVACRILFSRKPVALLELIK